MVMETADDAVARGKKRQLSSQDSEDLPIQRKTQRAADEAPVNFPSSPNETAGSYGASRSCCSSDGSTIEVEKVEEKEVTLEEFLAAANDDTLNQRERSETSIQIQVDSAGMESTARPQESNPRRHLTGEKMPSDYDLEEFFSSAEKNLQKQFIDKYNYDVAKDEPLEGRFEWVQIQQVQHDQEES